ncbi:MAG: hypothetical protein WBW44_03650 [Solirubrobacterales bacterium]
MLFRRFSFVLLIAGFFAFCLPVGASAEVAGADVCPGYAEPASMGDSVAEAVEFPYFPATTPQRYSSGAVLRPADQVTYPGRRPVVILQHGLGQDSCTLWWAAQYLAGHGFVAAVFDTLEDPVLPEDPDFPYLVNWATVAIQAEVSVVHFLETDPVASTYANTDQLGLAAYDEGAVVASAIDTGIHETPVYGLGIDAIVSMSNLRSRLTGDPGGTGMQCFGEPQGYFVPVTPALGFAEDEPCSGLASVFDPDIKLGGWRTWRSYGFPTAEIVLRGARHIDFADQNGDETFWKDAGHYTTAWFRRWLDLDPSQDQVLLSPTLNGRPTVDALSETFQSAAFLPPVTDTDDLTCDLGGSCLKAVLPDPKPDPEPDPDPEPVPAGPAKLRTWLKLDRRKVKPGGIVRAVLTVRNRGESAGTGRLCLKPGPLKTNKRRCRKLSPVKPGGSRKFHYRMRAANSLKPGHRFAIGHTLKADGVSAGSNSSIKVIRAHRARRS